MAQFHFVEDYCKHVDALIAQHPLDEAMSLAVGGSYEKIGRICADVLTHFGRAPGMALLDFGCGSGRTACALPAGEVARYTGIDVVPKLLDYADGKTPDHFDFICNTELTLPVADAAFDMIYAFSVFTHLLQAEIFAYLQDMKRALKPGGTIVFSFLEFANAAHWSVFESTLEATKASKTPHLNMFVERNQIAVWADRAGLEVIGFLDGGEAVSEEGPLGQSCVALRLPG